MFNLQIAVSETDKNSVRVNIATRRKVLETILSNGAVELNRFRTETESKVKWSLPQVKEAAQKLAQAEADFSILYTMTSTLANRQERGVLVFIE